MLTKRIIPGLDVKAERVVKGKSFIELRDAGDPLWNILNSGDQGILGETGNTSTNLMGN